MTRAAATAHAARRTTHGLRLPEGFRSRVIARGEQPVPGTDYRWHLASDGAATFPLRDGGWYLVSNSETLAGGASAIRFDRRGEIVGAHRILDGTSQNCSGGGTPWGTWLSCEETEDGRVWECDPAGRRKAVAHPAMGVFKHEAAAVDPRDRRIYLTEDLIDGGFYRFTPARWPRPRRRALGDRDGRPRRTHALDRGPRPARAHRRPRATRSRTAPASSAARASGTTTASSTSRPPGDDRVHAYDVRRERFQ